jgi:5-hydroxyisourate hydrolase-like protein (transthyretin family)
MAGVLAACASIASADTTVQITGTVTDASTDAPLKAVTVSLYNSGDSLLTTTTTAADGTYSFSSLATGTYEVGFDSPANYAPQFYKGKSTLASATPISVTSGSTTADIDAAMAAGGQVKGTVTDGITHAAVSQVEVDAFDSSGTFLLSTLTAGDGTYTLSGLATGSYKIRFVPTSGGYVAQFYNNKPDVASADSVSVTAGATTSGINAGVAVTTGHISGKVTDAATHTPQANVEVDVYSSGGSLIAIAHTAGDGTYTTGNVTAGTVEVGFVSPAGFAPQFYNGKTTLATASPVTVTAGATTANINGALTPGGRITGTVTDAGTHATLAGVSIQLSDSAGHSAGFTTTGADGTYLFTGLAAGTYTASFVDSGYQTQFYNGESTAASADPISVTAGSTTSGIDAAMAAFGGQISGTVTDASTHAAIAGDEVDIFDATSHGFRTSATTRSDGTYTVTNVSPGDYVVEFRSVGKYAPLFYNGKDSFATADTVSVVAGATAAGIDGKLTPGGAITGTATDAASNAGLPNMTVALLDSTGAELTSTQTGPDGTYQFRGLVTGTYEVEFFGGGTYQTLFYNGKTTVGTADGISVTAGATTSGINQALTSKGQITGTVTDASTSAGVANVQVDVYDFSGNVVTTTQTAAGGTYTVSVPVASYRVGFAAPTGAYVSQFYNSAGSISSASFVSVSPGQTTSGINAALAASDGKFTGTVTNSSSHAALAGILVQAYNTSDQPTGAAISTDATGKYTLGVAAGTYEVGFTSRDGTYTPQFYDGQSTLAAATAVTVTAGSTKSGIDAALVASTGRITGTVTNGTTHVPLVNVQVQLFNASDSEIANVLTAVDGTYTFPNLAAGTYEVAFFPQTGTNYLPQFYSGKATVETATPVTVTAGSTKSGINAALTVGGQITGTVTDAATHAALKSVSITVLNSSGTSVASALTRDDGTYTVPGLATGSYEVRFDAFGNYIEQFYNNKSTLATATSVSVTTGSTKSGIDAALATSTGQISGTVTDAATHTPQARVDVIILDATGGFQVSSTFTATDGTYTATSLQPGTYKVEFESPANFAPQFYNGKSTLASATTVTVTAGTTTTAINGSLTPGGKITGTVTDAATHATLGSTQVSLFDSTGASIASATTAGDGTYSFAGLATGSYRLGYSNFNGSYTPQFYNGKPDLSSADSVSVTAGSTKSGIDVALAHATGQISGKVTDAVSHVPVENATVSVYLNGFVQTTTTTAADGTYTISNLQPQDYQVGFTPLSGANYLTQFYNGKSTLATATTVTVTAGATTPNINGALTAAGKLTGTVTDGVTHAALGGVEVDLYDSTDAKLKNVTTAADGTYSFVGLPTGSYEVGFVSTNASGLYFPQFYNDEISLPAADPVSVTAGATTSGIDAALVPPSAISGTVTNGTTSTPVEGVTVDAYDSSQNLVGQAVTKADGTYTISGLPAGTFEIGFVPTGNFMAQFFDGKDSLADATPVSVTAGQTATGIDAALTVGGQIAGTVTAAADGTPLVGVTVSIYDSSDNFLTTAQTAADGTYTVPALTTGTYEVGFSTNGVGNFIDQFYNGQDSLDTATPVSVTIGDTTTGINAAMAAGGQIQGKVTNSSGTPVDSEVDVYDSAGDLIDTTETDDDPVTTQPLGTYTLSGLPSGTYEIGFSPDSPTLASQFYNGKATLNSADPVTVTAGSATTGIDATLGAGATITGTVTDASSGDVLANIEVDVYDSSDNFVTAAATQPGGSYAVQGLPAGTYEVGFAPVADYEPQFYNGKDSLATADPIDLAAGGSKNGVNAALTPSSGQISGTVTDATTHDPLGNVEVDVYDSGDDFVTSVITDPDGTYTFSGLGTGDYEVGFSPSTGGFAPQFYKNKSTLATATTVSVTAGATTSGIDAALVSGGQITGKVTNAAGGAAMANVEVDLYDSSEDFLASTTSAADGTYSFSGLVGGTYEVGFTPSGNFSPQFYNGKATLDGADPVSVTTGKTTSGINGALSAGGQISGTVTSAASHDPLQGVEVDVYDSSDEFVNSTTTAASGTYTLSGLTPGSYEVGFVPTGNLLPQFYNGQASLDNANAVTVTASHTTSGIDAALAAGGNISGTVTDAASGDPMVGVEVDVFDSEDNFITSTTTAADGTYTVTGLAAGSYEAGFFATGNFLPQYYNGKASLATASSVSVSSGETTDGIDAALAAGGQITGTATDSSTHAGVANVEVDLYDSTGTLVSFTDTAADGTYTLPGIAAGSYRVGFIPADTYSPQFYNGKSSLATADTVSVTTGSTTSGIDAPLTKGGEIAGTVTNASGHAPMAGVEVDVYDSAQNFVTTTNTGSDGTYDVSGLASGAYEVGFVPSGNFIPQFYNGQGSLATADPVSVTTGAKTSGIDAALSAGGKITGTVSDASSHDGVGDVEVDLYDSSGTFLDSTQTASDGTYTFSGLKTGSFKVGFSPSAGGYAPQFYNGKASLSAASTVSVTAGSTTSAINAALTVGGEITGTVTDAVTHAPLPNVEVDIYDSTDTFVTSVDTASDGTYGVSGLPAGTYEAGFAPSGDFAAQFYKSKASLAGATPITVTAGATTSSIDAALAAGGQISGTVTDAVTHAPLQAVEVDLYDSAKNLLTSTTTALNGTYTFEGLAPGTYEVGFSPSSGGYLPLFYNGNPTLATASSVTVTASHTTSGINGALALGGTITGTATDSTTGDPVGHVEVDLYDSSGTLLTSADTAADGTYSFTALTAASYKVGFAPSSGYAPQFYNGKSSLSAADAVAVTAGSTKSGIDAALVGTGSGAPGSITGTVTDASTKAGLSGIQVQAYDSSGKAVGKAVATSATGAYSISLTPGTYKIGFASPTGAYAAQFYNGKTTVASATAVIVTAGGTTKNINASLTPVLGHISGSVTDAATSAPLSGISVQAFAGGAPVGTPVFTGPTGGYTLNLAAGTYAVGFASPSGDFAAQFYNGQGSLASATPVTVKPNATTSNISAAMVAVNKQPPPPPPQISGLRESNKKFSAGKPSAHPKKGKKVGTVFSFQLSEAANVKILVELKGTGRKGPKGCAPQTRKNRHKRKCTLLQPKGTVNVTGAVGLNTVKFGGKVRGHKLKPGKYEALFTASNSSGSSATKVLTFTVVKKGRH